MAMTNFIQSVEETTKLAGTNNLEVLLFQTSPYSVENAPLFCPICARLR